jgi:predicted ATPase
MLLSSIRLKNILSFRDASLDLRPLNVLIGPNGVGKSNLIEVIGLLKAAPTDLNRALAGGVQEWLSKLKDAPPVAQIEYETAHPRCVYSLSFTNAERSLTIREELLQDVESKTVYFRRDTGTVSIDGAKDPIAPDRSVFSDFKMPGDKTPITRLGKEFERIRTYTDFNTGPRSQARSGVSATMPGGILDEDGANLAMALNDIDRNQSSRRIKEFLSQFNEGYEDLKTSIVENGILQTHIVERSLSAPVRATRLSDGTLKFLCLLVVLFNPTAPSLVCIEEPELGLHPDALRLVAEALREAAERMQIIVTTHSKELVDALAPEDIVVCERDFDDGTHLERLSREKLNLWLDTYSLGELWRKGEIGGNRW